MISQNELIELKEKLLRYVRLANKLRHKVNYYKGRQDGYHWVIHNHAERIKCGIKENADLKAKVSKLNELLLK